MVYRTAVAVLAGLLLTGSVLEAQGQPDFQVTRVAQPPVIDGVLEDEVWKREAASVLRPL